MSTGTVFNKISVPNRLHKPISYRRFSKYCTAGLEVREHGIYDTFSPTLGDQRNKLKLITSYELSE